MSDVIERLSIADPELNDPTGPIEPPPELLTSIMAGSDVVRLGEGASSRPVHRPWVVAAAAAAVAIAALAPLALLRNTDPGEPGVSSPAPTTAGIAGPTTVVSEPGQQDAIPVGDAAVVEVVEGPWSGSARYDNPLVFAVDEQVVLISSMGGAPLWRSEDRGTTWAPVEMDGVVEVLQVFWSGDALAARVFADTSGDPLTFLSDDGGLTWAQTASDTGEGMTSGTGVEPVIASTGRDYDPLPDYIPDAAISGDRVVIVGGNEEQLARIWFSDGGAWVEAKIEFPEGMAVGTNEGDFRLADGITRVDALPSGGFIAWENVQRWVGGDNVPDGTLILTSQDGATWTAGHLPEAITATTTFADDLIAFVTRPQEAAGETDALVWRTRDGVSWEEIASLGTGYPTSGARVSHSILAAVIEREVTIGEDGSVHYSGETTARILRIQTNQQADGEPISPPTTVPIAEAEQQARNYSIRLAILDDVAVVDGSGTGDQFRDAALSALDNRCSTTPEGLSLGTTPAHETAHRILSNLTCEISTMAVTIKDDGTASGVIGVLDPEVVDQLQQAVGEGIWVQLDHSDQ